MKQHEAVIKTMEEKGGYATLAQLYQSVDVNNWKTKTPFATIRRIVQDNKYFFKIKPGLWALNSYKDKVLETLSIDGKGSKKKEEEFSHSYYQGLLVEVGNMEGYETFIPNQDKNRTYLSKPLKDYLTAKEFYNFTYDHIIKKVNTVDVCWFNKRNFPSSIFEIEHSTDIQRSLVKFSYLQDFNIQFNIVADKAREREFLSIYSNDFFDILRGKVKFISYENLSKYHSKLFEIKLLREGFYK